MEHCEHSSAVEVGFWWNIPLKFLFFVGDLMHSNMKQCCLQHNVQTRLC